MTTTVSASAAVRAHRVRMVAFAALVGLVGTNLVAILVAAAVLGEPIQPTDIAGTALVIVGVWVGALRSTSAH
jgi:drug/metabolite transporter (DMT)-like permease